ncbi:pyrroloquinoline quinone precursor peptide PqqA [Bradyrhizobium sp. CCGUVB1N3]|uniref:pyrroloquinoline quinone precursor peptide PqqA n=1 Tax=Bradyrhizobium sp. CCGUVB1N3 TaxID=2949629 RepID=UPI0020B2A28E|nr:pyrroloquinoline quinone precursor peptide PqqA [Bradyrhizobium sp. CCGUVB1N3]MCP3469788.1 pyrroloquinoline quinone precursor peptide PqqA [Bradyrhizobium sp. CCGUVB1N3]
METDALKRETKEIQMPTATGLRASIANQLPSPVQEEAPTKWTTPRIVEIAVGLEINSYARAELN